MRYLNDIACSINDGLSANLPYHKLLAGVTNSAKRGKDLFPAYVDNHGEMRYLGPDDDQDIIIYHKVNTIRFGKTGTAWGNGKQLEQHVAQMSMIVFGRRDKILMTADELAVMVQSVFPERLTNEALSNLNFKSVSFKATDVNINSLQVFAEEFPSTEYFLKPEQFLFRFNYLIESIFLKGCFKTCE